LGKSLLLDIREPKISLVLIILGLVLGIWSVLFPVMFVIFLFVYLVYFFIYLKISPEERRFIIAIFTLGLLFRITFASLFYYLYLLPGNFNFFASDGETYAQQAWYISRVLSNKDLYMVPSTEFIFKSFDKMVDWYGGRLPSVNEYEIGIITYAMALIYAIFGYQPLILRIINCLFGALSAVLIYDITKFVFNKKVAYVAIVLTMFFPSLFLFSTTNLKDPSIIFLLILTIWAMTKFSKHKRILYLAVILISTVMIFFIRVYLFGTLILIVSLYFLAIYTFKMSRLKKFLILLTVISILLTPIAKKNIRNGLNFLFTKQSGYFFERGGISNYKIYPERFYQSRGEIKDMRLDEFLLSYFKGLTYVLFSPFPWHIKSGSLFLGSLLNFLWYFLFIFALLGILKATRYKLLESTATILTLFVITSLLALTSGNIGTVFRHRDMLIPFFLIFSAVGLVGLGEKDTKIWN
jgi:4-amino-4-deoxy-L-arabinose transferase-like glycosyltransferase